MKYRLLGFIVWCAMVFALARAAGQVGSPPVPERPEFREIAPLIDQLRHGADSSLRLFIGASNFEILKDVTTPITSTEARAAREKLRKVAPTLPLVRFTKNHEIAEYDLDERTTMEVEIDATPERWIRRTLEKIATYPNSAWKRFVEFALRNGLTGLTVYEQGTARFGEITFAAIRPAACVYPGGSLHFSPAFYEDMRVSPGYPQSSGTGGFVVLIHDPHHDVGGRFRLMSGLAALFTANPNAGFEYLVEGAFPEKQVLASGDTQMDLHERAIRDGGLGNYLLKFSEAQKRWIVNSMLRRFLVDTPLAFQLSRLPEPEVRGLAIDDDSDLSEPQVLFVEPARIHAALKALAEFVGTKDVASMDSEEAAARGMVLEGIEMTAALRQADSTGVNGIQLIKHLERLKAGFGALGDVASEISKSSPEMQAHADALEQESAAYAAEVQKCRNAVKRNEAMLPLIETAGRNSAKKAALAFISSYHIEGITRQLRTDGIAYVVIEPRGSLRCCGSERDPTRFGKFSDDPDAYFKSLAPASRGFCSLTEEQVHTSHIPFIKSILPYAIARENSIMSAAQRGNIDLTRLQLAVASNGWLVDSAVEIGNLSPSGVNHPGIGTANTGRLGSSGVPAPDPGLPAGTFAFFDEVDGKPRLVLLDKDSEHWHEEDRYARLAETMFTFPSTCEGQVPVVHFVSYPGGRARSREYFFIFKRDSKRMYLLEGNISSAAALLSLSTVRGGGSVNVDVHLGVISETK